MHILISLSEQKYHLTHILHTQLNSSTCFLIVFKKWAMFWKFGVDLFRWSQETEQKHTVLKLV